MKDFGEWLPDLPPFDNPGLITAENVLPGDNSYLPLPAPTKISNSALEGNALGAIATKDAEDAAVAHNFVGTSSKLYLLSDSDFSDVSIAGGYSTGTERWEFAQVQDEIIATNFADAIQTYTIGTSTKFANLGGSPPKARHIAKVGEFLVIGNIDDTSAGFVPQRVQWAGIGTTSSWAVSASTQADFQDLNNNYGWIQGIVGGEYGGLIFQERGIVRMTYVGSPLVFQFDVVNSYQGALAPGSIVNLGDMVAYLGPDGFYVFDGQTAVNIGSNKVNDFFFNDYAAEFVGDMSSAVYPQLSIVAWSYRSNAAENDMNDTILFYNYAKNATKRWSLYRVEQSLIFEMLTEGWTLEELDNYPPGSQTLETLPYTLDSRFYIGNKPLFGLITNEFKLAALTGDPVDANLITGETQFFKNSRAQINTIRPFVDYEDGSATVQMYVGRRENLNADVDWTGAIDLTTSGYATARSSGRYHRFRLTVSGTYDALQGIEVSAIEKQGNR